MRWLEVSLTVPSKHAEPIAEVLARFATNGIAIEMASTQPPSAGSVVRVRGWLPEDDSLDVKRETLEESLWHLSQIEPLPTPAYRLIENQEWIGTWRSSYRPIPVGRGWLITPPWTDPSKTDRIPIVIEPGTAFGTGAHPSTRLCLEFIEDQLKVGQSVADLGCGSGILSIAAAQLGAVDVRAFDLDPLAVQAARENVERNGVADVVEVVHGSLDELLNLPPRDLLLANILAPVLLKMIEDGLPRAANPEGVIILSGVLEEQVGELLSACASHGLSLMEVKGEDDWRALALSRNP